MGRQCVWKRRCVPACENPLQVRVGRCVQFGKGIPCVGEYPVGHGALHVLEEARVTSHPAHHRAGEEHAKEQPPAPVVPARLVECLALLKGLALNQLRLRRREWIKGSIRVRKRPKYRSNFPAPPIPLVTSSVCASQNDRASGDSLSRQR